MSVRSLPLLLATTLLALSQSHAQERPGSEELRGISGGHGMASEQLAKPFAPSSTQRTAGGSSRLTAAFTGNGNGGVVPAPFDSVNYYYGGGRGGDLKSGIHLAFDSAAFQAYDLTSAAYVLKRCTLKKFEPRNLDTNVVEQTYTAGAWANSKMTRYQYSSLRADSIVTKYNWSGSFYSPNIQTEYTYASLSSATIERRWVGGKFENDNKTTTTRNSAGQTIVVLEEDWNSMQAAWVPKRRSIFQYNANGSLALSGYQTASGVWVRNIESHYRYDASNVLVSTLSFYNWPSGWNMSDSSIRTQDPVSGLTESTTNYSYSPTTGSWSVGQRTINAYTPTKEYASVTKQNYDAGSGSWVNYNLRCMSYNSNDQLFQDSVVFWTNNAWEAFPRNKWKYYYEAYTPAGVQSSSSEVFYVSLYPIPSGDLVNIAIKLGRPGALNVSVVDAFGRKVADWNCGLTNAYQNILHCADLPGGYYTLVVQNGAEKAVKSFLVQH
jgi:hypothetical protein